MVDMFDDRDGQTVPNCGIETPDAAEVSVCQSQLLSRR